MWRIYRNSLVEKGRRLPTVNEVNGKEGVRRLLGCFQRGDAWDNMCYPGPKRKLTVTTNHLPLG